MYICIQQMSLRISQAILISRWGIEIRQEISSPIFQQSNQCQLIAMHAYVYVSLCVGIIYVIINNHNFRGKKLEEIYLSHNASTGRQHSVLEFCALFPNCVIIAGQSSRSHHCEECESNREVLDQYHQQARGSHNGEERATFLRFAIAFPCTCIRWSRCHRMVGCDPICVIGSPGARHGQVGCIGMKVRGFAVRSENARTVPMVVGGRARALRTGANKNE